MKVIEDQMDHAGRYPIIFRNYGRQGLGVRVQGSGGWI